MSDCFYEFLFAYLFFLPNADVIMTHHCHIFFRCSCLSVVKINVGHNTKEYTMDAYVDQWRAQIKACVHYKFDILNRSCKLICADNMELESS